jgi:cold shock protein
MSEIYMPSGTIKMFNQERLCFIKPDDGGVDAFFHESALRDGDEIVQGAAVRYSMGVDKRSGKDKAVEVTLLVRPTSRAVVKRHAFAARLFLAADRHRLLRNPRQRALFPQPLAFANG